MSTDIFPVSLQRDPAKILESVVSELEMLCEDAALGMSSQLISLHGALLVYNLEGWAQLIPAPSWSLSRRGMLQLRVTRAARRLAGSTNGQPAAAAAMERAARKIEELIHLIDPELRAVCAA